jgi:hypothetical protein
VNFTRNAREVRARAGFFEVLPMKSLGISHVSPLASLLLKENPEIRLTVTAIPLKSAPVPGTK